jgi:hypothetical protein
MAHLHMEAMSTYSISSSSSSNASTSSKYYTTVHCASDTP